jgi:RimJ/RimL family protein N-acetyltransferase
MEIRLESCTIRSWRKDDVASIVPLADNRAVSRNLRDRFPHPYGKRDAKAWIRAARASRPETVFALEVDGRAVGGIGLHPQADVHRRAMEIGYWLGEPYWGRGIVTEAVRALTRYAFETFDVARVYAYVYEWNPASARVLEKAGYRLEGRLRKAVTKEGTTMDMLVYAFTEDDLAEEGA